MVLVLIALASRAPWRDRGDAGPQHGGGARCCRAISRASGGRSRAAFRPGSRDSLTALQPLLAALLAAPLLGEKVTPRQWLGIAAGFIGIVLCWHPGSARRRRRARRHCAADESVNLGAVVSVTLGTFYQKRFVAGADLRTGTCLQYVGALAVVVPLALATETLRFEPTVTLLAALAWSVLVMSIAAIVLLLLLIRHGEVSRIATLIYLVPPFTALEAFILFGESLSSVQVMGMLSPSRASGWRRGEPSGRAEAISARADEWYAGGLASVLDLEPCVSRSSISARSSPAI